MCRIRGKPWEEVEKYWRGIKNTCSNCGANDKEMHYMHNKRAVVHITTVEPVNEITLTITIS